MKRCRRCGALLARDHQEDEWCTPCLALVREYDPRRDPLFLARLLGVLQAGEGQPVEPMKALAIRSEYRNIVKDGVRTLRRRGYVIQATQRRPGYVFVGAASSTMPLVTAVLTA